jgi:integrase/recombinase XerC
MMAFMAWFEKEHGQAPASAEITPLDIQQWKTWMNHRGWTPATINRRLAALRVYFRWAQDNGLCLSNPAGRVRDKRGGQIAPKALTTPKTRKLRHAAESRILLADAVRSPAHMTATAREARRDRAILLMFLNTGIRVSELCDLHVSDVCLKPRSGDVVIRSGKGDRRRILPLNADVRQTLYQWLDVRPAVSTEWVFIGRRGDKLRPRGVQRLIDRLARQAGLPVGEITPHVLRHAFAKSLIDAGESLTRVQTLLGHQSIVTTSRYTTPHPDDLTAAVERLSWTESH